MGQSGMNSLGVDRTFAETFLREVCLVSGGEVHGQEGKGQAMETAWMATIEGTTGIRRTLHGGLYSNLRSFQAHYDTDYSPDFEFIGINVQ